MLIDDFRSIVLQNRDLLDVRAPVEFEKGAFTNAVNIPILNDSQRHLIGIEYKKNGNASAIMLAEKLIQKEGKERRVKEWIAYIKEHPNAFLYCFRGGQRSGIAQEWLAEKGIEIKRLNGGYKAFRNYLMQEAIRISKESKTLILGGYTGSGKTILLQEVKNCIDLEAIANHKGSSFGNNITKQPSQIDFENSLAYALIQFEEKKFNHLVVEHESHNIGRAFMPKEVYTNLMDGELILLEAPLEERVEISHDEYVLKAQEMYIDKYGVEGVERWREDVTKGIFKIKKRLGDEKYRIIHTLFEKELYKEFIEKLLVEYYDPVYKYQIQKSTIPVVCQGTKEEVLDFIRARA